MVKGVGFPEMHHADRIGWQYLQARIEANLDLISRMLAERSEDLGISSDELISRILDE